MILFFRTLLIMIIPSLSSIAILPECGNGWSQFWNPCINDENAFNYYFSTYVGAPEVTIYAHNSVCNIKPVSFLMNKNEIHTCLRAYFDHWNQIIIVKLIIFIINPFIIYFIKRYNISWHAMTRFLLRACRDRDENNNDDNHNNNTNHRLTSIDTEYVAISSKIDICILYCMISPYIIPILGMSLYSNKIVYQCLSMD